MALNATVFKIDLQIADLDRPYYADHVLTVARHPSETDERMMVRVLAFALHAHERLVFGRGLSTEDEPDLWQRDLSGVIETWIDVGQPDERRLRKACGRAQRVFVYAYGSRVADVWWEAARAGLARVDNLCVRRLPATAGAALAGLAQRSMALQCTVQDGQAWLTDGSRSVHLEWTTLQEPAGR